MKTLKRFLVGLLVVACFVSCFALTSSAASDFTADNIEDVLEYYIFTDYLHEDANGVVGEKYVLDSSAAKNVSCNFAASSTYQPVVDGSSEDTYIQLKNTSFLNRQYTVNMSAANSENFVVSLKFKTSDAKSLGDGKDHGTVLTFNFNVNNPSDSFKPKPTINFFEMNCSGKELVNTEDGTSYVDSEFKFKTLEYNAETNSYDLVAIDGIKPELDTWYQIDAVYNFKDGYYTLRIVAEDGTEYNSEEKSLGTLESAITAYVRVKDEKRTVNGISLDTTGTYACFDNVYFYDGTFIRDTANKNSETAKALLNLDKLAKAEGTSLEDRIRIADVYNEVINNFNYVVDDSNADKEEVNAICENAKNDYIYSTYAEALITYAGQIDVSKGYYERIDKINRIAIFDDLIPSVEEEIVVTPGLDESDVEAILSAKDAFNKEVFEIDQTRIQSQAFIEFIVGYDQNNKDYNYIKAQCEAAELFSKRAQDYKYVLTPGETEEDVIYATVADAEAKFNELTNKFAAIESNIATFLNAVKTLEPVPQPTVGFKAIYDAYNLASSVYADGTVHPDLDPSTYPGLGDSIALYLEREAYVLDRVAQSTEFISLIDKASNAVYYITILGELDKAMVYIDDDIENYSVENEFAGVVEARAKYDELRAKLAFDLANANAYITACNAIKTAQGYSAKLAAVEAANALKATGNIVGIEGVKEANIILSEAEGEINRLQNYSATLIDTVAKLREAKTLSERRELIAIGNRCVGNVETSISGVTEAQSAFAELVAKYNSDVSALNNAFIGAVGGANAMYQGSAK